jgi:hypothetical protein
MAGFVDFAHRPEFEVTRKQVSETGSILPLGEANVTHNLLGSLRGVNLNHWTVSGPQVGPNNVSLPSPEDGRRNFVF